MARSSTFPLYDALLDGQLTELLAAWKAEGASLQEMTWRLRERLAQQDIDPVSTDTIRRWLGQIEVGAA